MGFRKLVFCLPACHLFCLPAMPFPWPLVMHGFEGSAWTRSLGVPLSDVWLLCGSIDGCGGGDIDDDDDDVVRCFIEATLKHS